MIRVVCATAYLAFAAHGRRPVPLTKESQGNQVAENQRPAKALESLLLSLSPLTAPRRSGVSRHHRLPHPLMRSRVEEVSSPPWLDDADTTDSFKVDEPSKFLTGLLAASMALAPSGAFAEDTVSAVVGMTEEAVKKANGELDWFGNYVKVLEDGLFLMHDSLAGIGFPYPYAASIFGLVLLLKTLTFPLNYQQLEGSAQMKATAPQRDLIQKWYADDQMQMNIQLGALFDKIQINPLSSILPSFAQIPILLGVYYASTSIAKAKIYDEGFLWIPSLIGPVSDRSEGISWLTEHRFGLEDTLAYLSIPIILVLAQTLSLKVLGSFDAMKEAEKNGGSGAMGKILYILPFFLGWVSMNAPAALGLYWLFSNIFTTSITATIRKLTEAETYLPEVDMAALGPRRDPLPLVNKNWNSESAEDESVVDVESEAVDAAEEQVDAAEEQPAV